MLRIRALLTAMAALPLIGPGSGCADSVPSPPLGLECDAFGADGATYELNVLNNFRYNVLVTARPEERDACWSLGLSETDRDDFPKGFQPSGSFRLWYHGRAPDTVPLEIALPLVEGTAPPGPAQFLAAFRWDGLTQGWRIVLPEEVIDNQMIVRSTGTTSEIEEQWAWGLIQIDEVDYDESLAPLLDDIYGGDEWAQIVAELEAIQEMSVDTLSFDCSAFPAIKSAFAGLKDEVEVPLLAYVNMLKNDCGSCDFRDEIFISEFAEYVQLSGQEWFWEQVVFGDALAQRKTKGIVQLFGALRLLNIWEQLSSLTCDYDCFFDRGYSGMGNDLAIYYVSQMIVDLVPWAQSHYGCAE